MEKKGNRNLPASKGAATDSKKDGASSRPWPRGCRRREPASSLSTKNDPSRKPQPQRDKTIDKRPKPRSGYNSYHTGAVGRAEAARLEESGAELGSVFLPGSKKQSLNHLLNFSYSPPHASRDGYQSERGRNNGGSGNRMLATRKHKYNKEHFLQANCQFVVNSSGDYKQYLNDPDALVDWNFVEQVNVQVSASPSCPICLYPPVAAKMTRCGHIYCWSCVLHYLSLSDKPSRKCPICYDTIQMQDLKSVIAIPHSTFNVNDKITFKKMKRARGCLSAYPADAEVENEDIIYNMSDQKAGEVYSKLLLAQYLDIMSIIARESEELQEQLAENDDCPEKCFIEHAITLLKEREEKVFANLQNHNVTEQKYSLENVKEHVPMTNSLTEVHNNDDSFDNTTDLIEGLDMSQNSSGQPAKFHYFYQASDGQHIYLHALNARMLEHNYRSLERAPNEIEGKILEKEGGSMTEELRKRFRHLQHLPITCQFETAEIQLEQPIVTKETVKHFHEQIEFRRKKRQRRAHAEKLREKRIEAEENLKMGRYPVANIHIESNTQFPEFGYEARLRTESGSTVPSERGASPDLHSSPSSGSVENAYVGPSFATMLAKEKKEAPAWPGLKPMLSLSEPPKLINVTGSKMKVSSTVRGRNTHDSDVEPDDYRPVPTFNRSFGDALAQIAQQLEENNEDKDLPASGKKKKKKKQKVLFTTTMNYSGN